MNIRPLYGVAIILGLIFVGSLAFHRAPVPKHQPVFKQIPSQLIAFIHYEGPYEDMPLLFKAIGKEAKFKIAGPAGTLYYPTKPGQKPSYDCYFPIKKRWTPQESAIQFKEMPSANMLVFNHVGPYSALEKTYEKTTYFFNESRISKKSKSREVYVKGPGWFFKGNPKKYITELQFEI